MTSKEAKDALLYLLKNQKPLNDQELCITIGECTNIVQDSLDKLERYENIIIPNLKRIIKKISK